MERKNEHKCTTCDQPVDQKGKCNNCWEVERRLAEYLESEKGRAFVRAALPPIPIVVTRRPHDFMASIASDRWECGETQAVAIGKLVISRSLAIGVSLEDPPKPE